MDEGLSYHGTWPSDAPPLQGGGNLTAFELPVVVRRPETALALLGGPKILAAHVYANLSAGDKHASVRHPMPITVDLRLRADDPFHHAIKGTRTAVSGLLLRVARPAEGAAAAAAAAPACQLLGAVGSTYRWDGMADFQVLPSGPPLVADLLDPSNSFLTAIAERKRQQDLLGASAAAAGEAGGAGGAALGAGASGGGGGGGGGGGSDAFPWIERASLRLNLAPASFTQRPQAQR
jgi:hypothetical protein